MSFGPGYMMLCAARKRQTFSSSCTSVRERRGKRTPNVVVTDAGDDLDTSAPKDVVHLLGDHAVEVVDLLGRSRQVSVDVMPRVVARPCEGQGEEVRILWTASEKRKTDSQMTKSTLSAHSFSSQSNVMFIRLRGESQSLREGSRSWFSHGQAG